MTQIPVNGEVLKWAREFRMLSLEDAAEKLGLSEQDLQNIEANKRRPSLGEFENFAHKYKLPQATLFRSKPPNAPKPPNDYRTFESRPPRFSYDFSVCLSNIHSLSSLATKIYEEDEDWKKPNLPSLDEKGNPESLGEAERVRLGISAETQLGWGSGEAFRRWRAIIESQGIFVFLQEFPIDDCRGFTIYEDNEIPIIVINKSEKFDRARTFTLLHEYGHILIRKPGISDLQRNPVEVFCNKFAAAILMPKSAIRLLIKNWPNEAVDWDVNQIKRWAGRLKVSQWALALRFEDLGLAPKGFHRKFAWHTGYNRTERSPDAEGGPDPNVTRFSEIGGHYVSKILSAMDRKIITQTQAIEALGINSEAFHKARKFMTRFDELARVEE